MSRKAVTKKSVSISSKEKTNILEVTNQVTYPETLAILFAVDYNIVDDMKKIHVKISMFELTKIMIQWDILLRVLGNSTIGNDAS